MTDPRDNPRSQVFSFAQTNGDDHGSADVPALLRRVADSIEQLGDVEVQDLVMHTELHDDYWDPSLIVYYTREN